ncbi:hypothetical protein ACFE04_008503 [Oxalis oulophora]
MILYKPWRRCLSRVSSGWLKFVDVSGEQTFYKSSSIMIMSSSHDTCYDSTNPFFVNYPLDPGFQDSSSPSSDTIWGLDESSSEGLYSFLPCFDSLGMKGLPKQDMCVCVASSGFAPLAVAAF